MTLYLVLGPPASGKSTWVKQHAKPGDVIIDYDALANVLTPPDGKPHKHAQHIKAITKAARQAAIDTAVTMADEHDVYVIHSMPSQRTIDGYLALGAKVVTIDPGIDVVMARCKAERPWQMQQAVKQWYADRASKLPRPASKHDQGVMKW
ncbi:polynucleotide kinase [Mycobacterium phage Tortellini]|uniref:Adenylate kinase n=1 Tax=Mycobacterium phage Tortellini TaxID=1897497 RepID=A0A1D8EX78_9CAUD|nr:terminase small subunit [Mycobacterium phage Tortellini]AOT25821.1 polynucleotide kinase [Mycobacterium phage Tortellini]